MVVSVALWSITATPGEPTVISPPSDIKITNIALGDELADESGRTTVKLIYRPPGADEEDSDEEDEEDEEDGEKEAGETQLAATVLCSLTPGKIEQSTVDVVLTEDDEYLIEIVGKNTVYLTGNYIDQSPQGNPYEDDEDMSDEEDYDLQDVSSDVEVDPEELDIPSDDEDRFEEIKDEEPSKADSKKRPRESDAMETEEQEGKLSKAQQQKLNKKLKAANGEAVPAETLEKAEKAEKKSKDKKKEKAEKEAAPKGQTKTLQGGVKVVDHKVGTGPQAKSGDTVGMRYIGKLENGKIFDQNTKGKPFKFTLGKGEVIKGWDVGVAGMQVGGERLLTIPAPMAYGKRSQAGIPGNSTLIFEVKLVSIK